ncbi:MAG: ATP-binding cassette domain-containing protein [Bacteroidales bacterium]
MKPIIKLENANIENAKHLILTDVNISIEKGEMVYLIGKVGSGKTSILRTITAEYPLKKGDAEVAGFNLRNLKKREIPYLRRKIGVVFQDFQLLMDRSIYDNLLFVLKATGWKDKNKIDARINEVIESVGMKHKLHKMPYNLSGGEQQRIVIARALLNNPDIILADEPTGNLDEVTANEIQDLFIKIHEEEEGPAIIMVTHNHSLYEKYPSRTILCEDMTTKEMEPEAIKEIDISDLI